MFFKLHQNGMCGVEGNTTAGVKWLRERTRIHLDSDELLCKEVGLCELELHHAEFQDKGVTQRFHLS